MGKQIENGAIKIIELVGVSNESFDDAVKQAVKKASESVKGISGVEVVKHMATVSGGRIVQYRADVKLAFAVE